MKSNDKIKLYILQAQSNNKWYPVADYPITDKNEAIGLLKYKKKSEKGVKWRVILRTISDRKIA
jgi:hypothetical protein